MAFTYRKGYEKGDLVETAGITHNIVARMGKDAYVDLRSIEKVCKALDCRIENVVEIVPDEQENKNGGKAN